MSVSSLLSTIAPQFDSVTGRADFIALAELQVNRCLLGEKADIGTAYFAAHLIQISQDSATSGGSSGEITSKKEGDLSVSYGNFAPKDGSGLSATSWGRQYDMIIKTTVPGLDLTCSGFPDGC